jgi:hypothetical protein
MTPVVAIQPDDYTSPGREPESDASSPKWRGLLEAAGYEVRIVDVHRADVLDQVDGCIGFMWRWGHEGGMSQIAQRLLPVLERELGFAVYPDQATCWHYDDKIAQAYLLSAAGIPCPETWVWFDRDGAERCIDGANFPVVLKLATGAGSANVRLVRTPAEARSWVGRLFGHGVGSLAEPPGPPPPPVWADRVRAARRVLVDGLEPPRPQAPPWPLHKDYLLMQEFLAGNEFDTRVTVIGNRAFAFRRFNRPNDFRASGSGRLDWDPGQIDLGFVRLALDVAARLRLQSCAIDGLYRGREPVVGEISYTYMSDAVHACPGHWELAGGTAAGTLEWHAGQMWPEEAQVADFIPLLEAARGRAASRQASPHGGGR